MFFGLLAIAANSMSQPTGRICDTPAHINAQLRISPIVCVVDTLFMISRFFYHSLSEKSVYHGARVLIVQRFYFDDDNDGDIHRLQRNSVLRGSLGVITTFQAVRIFCSQHVYLAKVWSGIYIAHWMFGEALILTKKKVEITGPQAEALRRHTLPSHGPGSIAWIVVAISALFPLHFGALGISGLAKSKGLSWSPVQSIGLVVLVFGCVPFIAASLYSMRGQGTRTFRSSLIPLLAVLPLGLGYSALLGIKPAAHLHGILAHIVTAILAVVWASLGLLWAATTLLAAPEPINGGPRVAPLIANRNYARCLETWLTWWMVAIHLVSAWLFYTYEYNTQGKARPRWSEPFG